MKKIFWEIISFWGTLLAGLLIILLAFFLDTGFGLVVFANMFIITLLANTWKVHHFKPRPDNPEGIRPIRPFDPRQLNFFLDPDLSIKYFHYVDAGSFPSIHSARSFNQALLFAAYFGASGSCGGSIHLILLGFAALVAWSRVVKMRHFKTDIAAGAVLGLLLAWISMIFI